MSSRETKNLARSFIGPGEAVDPVSRCLNRIPLPFRFGRRTVPVVATGPRPGADGSVVAPVKRVPERTSGSAAARRGFSPERELYLLFGSALGRLICTRFPESGAFVPFRSGLPPVGGMFGRLARDRGRPFAVTALGRPSVRGDSSRRIWSHKTRCRQPPERVCLWRGGSVFTFPTISRRIYRPRGRTGRASPRGGGRAPASAAVSRPPSKGDSFRRVCSFVAHWSCLRLWVSCALSKPGPLHPTRLRRSFPACLAVPLRFPWRSDKSFRLHGYDVRRFLPRVRGDSLRRVWEMAFVAAVPPARVRPLSRLPLIPEIIPPPYL